MPRGWKFFCANARGCPGGMVRVGVERDINQCINFLQISSVRGDSFKRYENLPNRN